ncbi:molybdopterin molybdotransferase MoeA [Tunicatimonas pelagia]|uniref:molybdopterin molybdotransferase MoeA n=1 Tax=Tunicatimonas pelagia TaxID=931531 RepID=UPI002666AAD0|nr:molybdopterin molybdotransferase MoeA [Tunicatimonas pelagia]WKN46204.1 molybdopterin molybdotransferase MoeA [Tunicatimonas pelagia]
MISSQEATQIINNHLCSFPTETVNLAEAQGKILQETIQADRDFPPFHRVTMDGIAYDFNQLQGDNPTVVIEGMQLAGEPQKILSQPNQGFEVMTGSVLPQGTNTVTPYEDIDIQKESGETIATLKKLPSEKGKNVHPQGYDRSQNDGLISAGTYLGATQIAVAASVGRAKVQVTQSPNVAIVSTGDELVDVDQQLEPYQIRQSNNYALRAALANHQVSASFYHLSDSLEKTTAGMAEIMEKHSVIILSGGVSRGKRDYVPDALKALGVKKLFHRVKQRPGKPFWFGMKDNQNAVFALPGNPVSTFMCFHRYFVPWLEQSLGLPEKPIRWAMLSNHIKFEPELIYFPTVLAQTNNDGQFLAEPIEGHGSGDFANLLRCNGFLELPADRSHFRQGEVFPFIPFT